jgi:acyl carrier protein
MIQNQMLARVEAVFATVFGDGVSFTPTLTRIDEEQWTSLKHVEFIIALEQEFGVRFDGADATDMTSIAVVIERLQQRLS